MSLFAVEAGGPSASGATQPEPPAVLPLEDQRLAMDAYTLAERNPQPSDIRMAETPDRLRTPACERYFSPDKAYWKMQAMLMQDRGNTVVHGMRHIHCGQMESVQQQAAHELVHVAAERSVILGLTRGSEVHSLGARLRFFFRLLECGWV